MFEALVSKVVNDTVFPKKQFIILERELDSDTKLAVKVLEALNMHKDRWHEVKEKIRKGLNRKRNNAQHCVRKSLLSKCCCHVSLHKQRAHVSYLPQQDAGNQMEWEYSA